MAAPTAPPTCPRCGTTRRQTRAGQTKYHSPRLHCTACDKDYTPQPKTGGYPPALRPQAIALHLALHLEGLSLRAVARLMSVNPQSVANWVAAHQKALEQQGHTELPMPAPAAKTVELDELHVFVGARKGEKNAGFTLQRR